MTQIMTGLISVARDWRLVYKAMLDLHFQKNSKKKTHYKYVHVKIRIKHAWSSLHIIYSFSKLNML